MAADLVVDGAAGDEVGDARGRPGLDCCACCAGRSRSPPRRRRGPVFVALPMDVLDAAQRRAVVPTSLPDTRVAPAPRRSRAAAALLAGAERPIDHHRRRRRAVSGAQAELTRVAELLGADGLGRELLRGQHRRRRTRSSAASSGTCSATTAAAIVAAGRRGADRAARTSSPRSSPRSSGVFAPGAQGRPHRPRRLRDRQELPGRPRPRRRPEADARPCWPTRSSAR